MSKSFLDNQSQPSQTRAMLSAGCEGHFEDLESTPRSKSSLSTTFKLSALPGTTLLDLILPSLSLVWILTTSQGKCQDLCDGFGSRYHFKTPAHIWMLPFTAFTLLGDDLIQVRYKQESLALMGFFSLVILCKKEGMLFGLPWCYHLMCFLDFKHWNVIFTASIYDQVWLM